MHRHLHSCRQRVGFTLIEILVVALLIAILSAIGMISVRSFMERNRLRVFFRPVNGVDPARLGEQIRSRIVNYLTEKDLDECVQVEVEQVPEIPRDPTSGKIRQIYSKVERLYLPGKPLGERRSGEDRRSSWQKAIQGERRRQKRREADGGDSEKK